MVYFPAGEAWLKRRPLFTAALAAGLALAFGWFLGVQLRELHAFGDAPQPVDISRLASPPKGDFAPGGWIELRGDVRFHCDSLLVDRNYQEGEMAFGHSKLTYVAATDVRATRLLIFVVAGEKTCDDIMQGNRSGVIREASRYDLEKIALSGYRVPSSVTVPPMRFETYAGPNETRKMAAMTGFATAFMTFSALWFWRKYRIAEKKKETGWAQYAGRS